MLADGNYVKAHPCCMEARAVDYYGTTGCPEYAGWLLADGRMLDYSEGGVLMRRTLDHRDIEKFMAAERWKAIVAFMRRGHVRMGCSGSGYYMERIAPLTEAQKKVLKETIRYAEKSGIPYEMTEDSRDGRTMCRCSDMWTILEGGVV